MSDYDRQWTWITSGGERVCPDCAMRHGVDYPLDIWESIGLPGDGTTLCMDRCMCLLLEGSLLIRMAQRRGAMGILNGVDALNALGIDAPFIAITGAEQSALIGAGFSDLADMEYMEAREVLIEEIRGIAGSEAIAMLDTAPLYELIEIYERL